MTYAGALVSIVIPTKDRPELLGRCLTSVLVACDRAPRSCEVVVVDDGSSPPVVASGDRRVRVVRTSGVGPSRARNVGIEAAKGDVIAFTDDDVEVGATWLAAALGVLDGDANLAGVTGRTDAPGFDPLYEHSVTDNVGGSFLTCNVAYRASALRAVGGFDRQFPHAAHEDRDLAWRIQAAVGDVVFVPEMVVLHPGRRFTARESDRRARFIVDDWLLFSRYPEAKRSRLPVRVAPLVAMARRWVILASADGGIGTSPRRAARWGRLAVGQVATAAWVTASQWRHFEERTVTATPGLRHPGLRIAYVGPVPNPLAGGAPGVAGMLLTELATRGASIDCYVATSRESGDAGALDAVDGIEFVTSFSRFGFERWYSRHRLSKMASHQLATALARRRLADTLAARHRAAPYDVLYQFSNLESFGVPPRRAARPPTVVHPSVHAAGELRWMRNERLLAAGLEGARRPTAVRAWLAVRVVRQRRDARRADRVLALSHTFARDLVADYGLDPDRVAVVPNCIDLDRFSPVSGEVPMGNGHVPARVLSAGRFTVRKGLEDVVAVTHALRDRKGEVEVCVVGSHSLWSDYSALLEDLEPGVGKSLGYLPRDEVATLLTGSLCLLQLSRYEPFGLTVAEALACGVPVIVTAAVGAAEGLSPDVARVVEPGDASAVVEAIDDLLALRPDERAFLAARCRAEATRFAPATVAERLEHELVLASQPNVS